MSLEAILIGIGAIMVIGIAIGAAIAFKTYPQEQTSEQERPEPVIPNFRTLGPCFYCKGDVNTEGGYQMPCGHFSHYTCVTTLKMELGKLFDPNRICTICMTNSMTNRGASRNADLRNRNTNNQECVTCIKPIAAGEIHRMECTKHVVHETCWKRMVETSTTCPGCMESDI